MALRGYAESRAEQSRAEQSRAEQSRAGSYTWEGVKGAYDSSKDSCLSIPKWATNISRQTFG